MLRAALRRYAAHSPSSHSPCTPILRFKSSTIRAGHRAMPSQIRKSAITTLARDLTRSCRQDPIRTTPFAQWTTLRKPQTRFFSASNGPTAEDPLPVLPPRPVGIWLMVSSTLVFAIIVVGGITRLTESGLSITEWRPITGILPPLTHDEWVVEFDKYKGTPEFRMYVLACQWSLNTQLIFHIGLIPQLHSMTSSSFTAWNGVTVS